MIDMKYQKNLFLNLSLRKSISQTVIRHRAKVNIILFQLGSKKVLDVNISKGTSEISPKISKLIRYFFLLLVLKNPSTIKNIKIGKAILPKIEKILERCSKKPRPSKSGVMIALLTWSISMEVKAIYFSQAPLKI